MKLQCWTLICLVAFSVAGSATAQTTRVAVNQTRDAEDVALLERPARLVLGEGSLATALVRLSEASGVAVAFSPSLVAAESRRVRCDCEALTLSEALQHLLSGTPFDYQALRGEVLVFHAKPPPTVQSSRRYAMSGPPGIDQILARSLSRTKDVRERGTIIGRVTAVETDVPLASVQVSVDGAGRTLTDSNGRFRIGRVDPGLRTVSVSSIGYRPATRQVDVADGATVVVDFVLEISPTMLDDLVVTATGEQRRLELGHVVGTINADSMVREAPVTTLAELLNGRIPGLQVFQTQGTVGGDVRVQIRGPNSLALGSEPIVIVDGIRYQDARCTIAGCGVGSIAGTSTGAYGNVPTARLNDLNVNDIESIEVVKGPSAATLYGTDASNGVIVITTKRGRPGPAQWNMYTKATTMSIPAIEFPAIYWGWTSPGGIPSTTASCTLRNVAAGACAQDSIATLNNPLNDPQLSIFESKPSWQLGANVAGGADRLRYYFAADLESATGPVRMPAAIADSLSRARDVPKEQLVPNALSKINLRANLSADVGSRADVILTTGYTRNTTRTLVGAGPFSTPFARSTPTQPYGSILTPIDYFAQMSTEQADRFIGSATGNWTPLAWLTARVRAGLDLTNTTRLSLTRLGDAPLFSPTGSAAEERARHASTSVDAGVTASFGRGRWSSSTSTGLQYVHTSSDALLSSAFGLPPGGKTVSSASTVSTTKVFSEKATLGSYVQETIGLNDRLFLTGALRLDGATTFGRNYDSVIYPKAGASWLISEEPFTPRIPGLSELRLRYAFGASGQQPLPQWALPTYGNVSGVAVDGRETNTITLVSLGNPDLRPERTREHEFGFDLGALQNRVQFEATWYRQRTVDQIVNIALAPGLGSIYTNFGLTEGHGTEVSVSARLLDSRTATVDLALRHSSSKSELLDLGGAVPVYNAQGGYVEGYPLGARFMRPLLGFSDTDGDGIISPGEIQLGDEAVYIGPSTPETTQAMSASVGLFDRRLRLSALLERRSDFTQIDFFRTTQCQSGRCRAAVDPTAPLDEQAKAVASLGGAPAGQPFTSYQFHESGDYTRLSEMSMSMTLPDQLVNWIGGRGATLSLTGRNLALWTSFSGFDPQSASISGLSGGTANGIPQSRTWSMRLDLGL